MKFTAKETVRGISNMEYKIDGETVLSLAAHVDVPLDPQKGGKGWRTEPMKVADADVVKAVSHNPFPMVAELEIEQRAGKKQGSTELVILSIKPLNTGAPAGAKGA